MRSLVPVLILAFALLAGPSPAAAASEPDVAPAGCPREMAAVFWGGAQELVLGQALAAASTPCVEYSVTVTPQEDDRTRLRAPGRFDALRVLGIHPVAEMRWTTKEKTGWREWVVGGHPTWRPGRTFYGAGVLARRRMADVGLDVGAGETWAFNELTPEVLEGAPGARAEVLEFMRGLYDGDPGMPKARGIVFNVGIPSTAGPSEVAAYKASLQEWLSDEPFWTELDTYTDVFANEVYASPLSWGVRGAPLDKRVKHLNDYLQHMAVLADAGPESIGAARRFLQRKYMPLANALWPNSLVDTHLLSDELMSSLVSTQVYALRDYAESHPGVIPQDLVGFAWAPNAQGEGYTPGGRDQIAKRLAEAVLHVTDDVPGSPKDACGLVGMRGQCAGNVEDAWLNTAWLTFTEWD